MTTATVGAPPVTGVPMWDPAKSRQIVERVVIEGTLRLETPARFGNGDDEGSLLTLIVDETPEGPRPLLTGASIAGALRSYLTEVELGDLPRRSDRRARLFGAKDDPDRRAPLALTVRLFGGAKGDETGEQSALIVDDAYGSAEGFALRSGVRLAAASRTAEEGKLYTFMVWPAGTTFPLRFELAIARDENADDLKRALATALTGLSTGAIPLGARKRRGFGRVSVRDWRVKAYPVGTPSGMLAWVKDGAKRLADLNVTASPTIAAALAPNGALIPDRRTTCRIEATFAIDGSLLIREPSDVADMRHLRSGDKSVVSGTSLAGAIRARAQKIVNTIAAERAKAVIDDLFGVFGDEDKNGKRQASRVTVEERPIDGGKGDLVQSRVSIDRFTGGALDTALFNQQPHFGGNVTVAMTVRQPKPAEIGLLLLVLKDLWTGDLPIGGEQSVGRGRLNGQKATITADGKEWTLTADGDKVAVTGQAASALEEYVQALHKRMGAEA
ncbi:MAG: RAMP superfamily CRISPR-associated protein [Dehalococcoidia bacterium]|nr:RAMP superfamily CRISPR-associated protein [Dehalococcoidia bacterium]